MPTWCVPYEGPSGRCAHDAATEASHRRGNEGTVTNCGPAAVRRPRAATSRDTSERPGPLPAEAERLAPEARAVQPHSGCLERTAIRSRQLRARRCRCYVIRHYEV